MTRTTVNTSTILGKNYNIINIRANNNNPSIDDEVTITVTVTDVYNDPVSGYQVQLYKDGTSMGNQYKANTNSNGVATFNYTFTDWEVHHFTVENTLLPLQATGLKLVQTKTNNVVTYQLYIDGSTRTGVIKVTNNQSFNVATGEQYTATGLFPEAYSPPNDVYFKVNRNQNLSCYAWTGGTIGLYNTSSTTLTNQNVSGFYTYKY